MKGQHLMVAAITMFLVFQVMDAAGSSFSQEKVEEGRYLLFNSGEPGGRPTYGAIAAADACFQAGLDDDSSDQDARFFRSLSRLAVFGLTKGAEPGTETLRDILEAFGIQYACQADLDKPINPVLPQVNRLYHPPDTMPTAQEAAAFLTGSFTDCLDGSINDLEQVDMFYTTTITARESGDLPVSIDKGDIFVLKAGLYALRSFISLMTAYNLEVDLREVIAVTNSGMGQIQRDILDRYPHLFELLSGADGQGRLDNARADLLLAAEYAGQAHEILKAGGRNQHLFFYKTAQDQEEAAAFMHQVAELEASLKENRSADFSLDDREVWILTDAAGAGKVVLDVKMARTGQFISGYAKGLYNCDFLFCSAGVTGFDISGDQVEIRASYGWSCPRSVTLRATLNGDQMTAGTYELTDCAFTRSGNFTGERVLVEPGVPFVDPNAVFGNAGKPSMDLRAELPRFNVYDRIVPGSFPSPPVMNGFLTGVVTNEDAVRVFDLQPSGNFTLPLLSIALDGNPADWPAGARIFSDPQNDSKTKDINGVYMARDADFYYFAMDFFDTLSLADADPYGFSLGRTFERYDIYVSTYFNGSKWTARYYDPRSGTFTDYTDGSYAAGSESRQFIEWKIPAVDIESALGSDLNGFHIQASAGTRFNCYGENCLDWNHTGIRINTSSLSGTVFCPGYSGKGHLFITAMNGPIPHGTWAMSSDWTAAPGPFTLERLPIGAHAGLIGVWDADHNGIFNLGDAYGVAGPWAVAESGTTGADIIIDKVPQVSVTADRDILAGETAAIEIDALDPDGWPVRMEWAAPDGGSITAVGLTAVYTPPPAGPFPACRIYGVRAKVFFRCGLLHEEAIGVRVRPHQDLDGDGDGDGLDIMALVRVPTLMPLGLFAQGFGAPGCTEPGICP